MIEVVVGPAPDGALELGDDDDADDVREAVAAALRRGPVTFSLKRPGPARRDTETLSLVAAFEAIAAEATGGEVTCYVATDAIRERLLRLVRSETDRRLVSHIGGWRVLLRTGDLTAVIADAVVNASNTRLKLGAGISGALARACGPGLQAEMDRVGGLTETSYTVTGAHRLRTTSRIIHVPTASGERSTVRRALENILQFVAAEGLRSVAIPALGTGTGGLPFEDFAAECVGALTLVQAVDCTVIVVMGSDAGFSSVERVFIAAAGHGVS